MIMHYVTMVMTGVATIIMIGYAKPFQSKMRNLAEITEEVGTIVIMYHVFCFTDWLPDLEVRHNLGYSVIGCMGIQLFGYLAVLLFLGLRGSILSCQRARYIKNAKKKAKKQAGQTKIKLRNSVRNLDSRRACWLVEQEEQEAAEIIVDSEDSDESALLIVDSTTQVQSKPPSTGYCFLADLSMTPKMLTISQAGDILDQNT